MAVAATRTQTQLDADVLMLLDSFEGLLLSAQARLRHAPVLPCFCTC